MSKINKCSLCEEINEPDNFICAYCGFDLDYVVTRNHWGLPVLTPRKKNK